jgi:DNA-binding GntR family transcriptional regulator
VDELYEYRTVLEVGSLRVAQERRTPLTSIETATAALVELPDDAPWSEVIDTHQEIHRAIVRLSGNARILEAYALCEQRTGVRDRIEPPRLHRRAAGRTARRPPRTDRRAVTALARDIETGRRAVHDAVRDKPTS